MRRTTRSPSPLSGTRPPCHVPRRTRTSRASRRSEVGNGLGANMRNDVKLKDVTADNWEAVVDLELSAEQEDLVASNVYSLAESKFDPDARPRAVYAGRRVVGFLMY